MSILEKKFLRMFTPTFWINSSSSQKRTENLFPVYTGFNAPPLYRYNNKTNSSPPLFSRIRKRKTMNIKREA